MSGADAVYVCASFFADEGLLFFSQTFPSYVGPSKVGGMTLCSGRQSIVSFVGLK